MSYCKLYKCVNYYTRQGSIRETNTTLHVSNRENLMQELITLVMTESRCHLWHSEATERLGTAESCSHKAEGIWIGREVKGI